MKLIQYLITFLLLAVLGAMVGGYIYYGMNLAKNAEVPEVKVDEISESDAEKAKRTEIIEALSHESVEINEDQKQAIIDGLENPTPAPTAVSDAERMETINALNQN